MFHVERLSGLAPAFGITTRHNLLKAHVEMMIPATNRAVASCSGHLAGPVCTLDDTAPIGAALLSEDYPKPRDARANEEELHPGKPSGRAEATPEEAPRF